MAGKKGPPLRTINEVSAFLGKLIRELYRGDVDEKRAGKLAYMCNILKGCLEVGELERRLEDLEAALESQKETESQRTG
jgi:hypothetical protein